MDNLLAYNKSVFAKDKYDIGIADDYEAHIDLLIEKYGTKRLYHGDKIEDKKEIKAQIAKLIEKRL